MSDKDENADDGIPITHIRNWPFFGNPSFDPKRIESAMDYMPRDGDIILSSYPKTGTTWMQYIIWQILHKGESFPNFGDMTFSCAPFMELTGTEAIDALTSPRFYKVHFSYHMMKINEKAKYVCIYRNPLDVVASFYHFVKSLYGGDFKFDSFFEKFLDGRLPYGDYFDHTKSYYNGKSHIFMVSYEELCKDTRAQILKLAEFLGSEYYQALCDDDTLLQKILDVTSFKYMKGNLESYVMVEKDGTPKKRNFEIFRKGVVGDGKTLMSQEQIERMAQMIKKKMNGTPFPQLWSIQ